jgi:cohesin complex subunit SA-1/2
MENGLRGVGIEISSNRMWEGYRAYEKRLVLIASKDSNIRAGAARVVEQEAEQEQEQEQEEEEEEEQQEEGTEKSVSPTPRAVEEEEEDEGLGLEEDLELPDQEMDFDLGDLDGDVEPSTPGTKGGKRRSMSHAEVESARPKKKSRK